MSEEDYYNKYFEDQSSLIAKYYDKVGWMIAANLSYLVFLGGQEDSVCIPKIFCAISITLLFIILFHRSSLYSRKPRPGESSLVTLKFATAQNRKVLFRVSILFYLAILTFVTSVAVYSFGI